MPRDPSARAEASRQVGLRAEELLAVDVFSFGRTLMLLIHGCDDAMLAGPLALHCCKDAPGTRPTMPGALERLQVVDVQLASRRRQAAEAKAEAKAAEEAPGVPDFKKGFLSRLGSKKKLARAESAD